MHQFTRPFRPLYAAVALAGLTVILTGCGGGTPDLNGNWSADDGTGTKVINDAGACRGMFSSDGRRLDIGGGTSCSLSETKGSNGQYSLGVSQPPNQGLISGRVQRG